MDRPEDVQPHPTNGKVFVLLTNNAAAPAGAGRQGQSAAREPLRARHRDDRARRRPHRRDLPLGYPDQVRRPAHRRRSARSGTPQHERRRLVRLARQLRHRRRGAAVDLHRPGHGLAAHAARRRALRHRDRGRAARPLQAVLPRAGRRRAVRALLHPRRHHACSSRSSTPPPTASGTGSRSAASRPSRTPPPAGPTSTPACRRGPRWWRSASGAAAGSPARARLCRQAWATLHRRYCRSRLPFRHGSATSFDCSPGSCSA